jgi:NADH dehydrogenase [ubiquinone] 1 alpha subcomplex assembly factor 6
MARETLRRIDEPSASNGLSPAAALVRRHDRDRFQTALFAPAEKREALFALYAFNYEIARVRESVREPMLGQIRLQWWREAIDAAYGGGAPRQHEIVVAVTGAIRSHPLSQGYFERLINAREHDLDEEPPATFAALEDYAENSSAPLILLALEVLEAVTPVAHEAARHIGIAYALSGILRALPHRARIGQLLLPTEAGLDLTAVTQNRDPARLREAVAMVAAMAVRHLAEARRHRRAVPARAFPALLSARIAAMTLKHLARARFDPFAVSFATPDPLQPWRLAAAMLIKRF